MLLKDLAWHIYMNVLVHLLSFISHEILYFQGSKHACLLPVLIAIGVSVDG